MRIDGIASAPQIDLFRFANLGSLLLALRYYFTHSFRKYLLRIITVMKTRSNSIVLYIGNDFSNDIMTHHPESSAREKKITNFF